MRIVLLALYKVIRKRFVQVSVFNYEMRLDLGTPGLSRVLFVYRKRELLDTYVIQQEVYGNMNVLEVGANIGYYALMEASQLDSGKIFALEPDPRNISLLKENIALNNFQNKIEVFPIAASNKTEQKEFHLGRRTNVSSFVSGHAITDTVTVNCIALDTLDGIRTIDFIRMDVEGYECKVLQGLTSLLHDKRKSLQIFIEVHYSAYNETDLNFKQQLQELFALGFKARYIISAKRSSRYFEERNYTPVHTATETRYTRNLYKDVSNEDTTYFFERGIIRSLLLARV